MARAAQAGAGAILTLSDSATITFRAEIAAAAHRHRLVLALSGFVAATAFASGASARGSHRMAIYKQDGDTVTKIYDDGNLDGRGCIIGKQAVFDPTTGGL